MVCLIWFINFMLLQFLVGYWIIIHVKFVVMASVNHLVLL